MTEHAFAVELLDIEKIAPNPRNPQEGDIGGIATAIAADGWHGAIMCRSRGKDLPMLFAGEHRWRALAMLQRDGIDLNGKHVTYDDLLADKSLLLPPAGKIPGQILSLDEMRAMRKMLADNRASALAVADEGEIVALLQDLAEQDALLGSLFDGDDLDALLEAAALGALDLDTTGEVRTPRDRAAQYAEAGIRSVILPMAAADYDALIGRLNQLRTFWDLETNTDVVVRAVAEAAADANA